MMIITLNRSSLYSLALVKLLASCSNILGLCKQPKNSWINRHSSMLLLLLLRLTNRYCFCLLCNDLKICKSWEFLAAKSSNWIGGSTKQPSRAYHHYKLCLFAWSNLSDDASDRLFKEASSGWQLANLFLPFTYTKFCPFFRDQIQFCLQIQWRKFFYSLTCL